MFLHIVRKTENKPPVLAGLPRPPYNVAFANLEVESMSDSQKHSDNFVDAVAAVLIIAILVSTAIFWVLGQ